MIQGFNEFNIGLQLDVELPKYKVCSNVVHLQNMEVHVILGYVVEPSSKLECPCQGW